MIEKLFRIIIVLFGLVILVIASVGSAPFALLDRIRSLRRKLEI